MSEPTHNEVHVQSRMNMHFYGPVILGLGTPFVLICVFVFAVFASTHWSALVSLSPIIIYGVLAILGITLFSLTLGLVIKRVIQPLIQVQGMRLKNKVLHTEQHYTIILHDGQPVVVPISQEKINYNIRQVENQEAPLQIEAPKAQVLPTYVRYEDIRHQIPQGHTLVGLSERGVESKEEGIKALIWFVGASGTGKTNSVTLRVEEDDSNGYRLLVIDPHIFKDDSLYNAVKGYAHRFLLPVASEPEDILRVLDFFLNEFAQRKAGATWSHPIRIIVDEVGSLTSDIDKDNPQEVEIVRKLKEVVRICGQESRGFKMGGFFISQDAAGLAWLRKRALMVVAHQMMMWSERLLVCNQNTEVARDMDTWPIGRTLIYGIGFKEGQRVFQQPVHSPRIVESNAFPHIEDLQAKLNNGRQWEEAQEAEERYGKGKSTDPDLSAIKNLRDIGRRLRKGETRAEILKSYGATSGRLNQEIGAAIDSEMRHIAEGGM